MASLTASAQVPVANFTASPLAGCSPLIVVFQDQSTGNPTSWLWDFGNSNTSTLRNPSATYFTPGTYTVTLKVTNANGTNTLVRTAYIKVYEPPVVNFSASNITGCFPLRVPFTDLSTPGAGNTNVSWLWDFGNGTISTQQNPLAVYPNSGLFTVTLRVTNDKGCVKAYTRTNYINVTPGVKAGFTHTSPTICSAPASITFTNTSTGPGTLSYQWNFGDGSPVTTIQHPIHTFNTAGTYTVTLVTASSAGCIDTVRSTPIIIGGSTPSFTISNACINQPVNFTNTSSPVPVTTNWTFGDGGIGTGLNASHVYTTAGTYTVWMYNVYPGCRDSISQTITVNPSPVTDFTAPVRSKCQPPLTVNFQDLSTGGATSWQWNFGDGNTSTLQNPTHTYTTYGNFTVSLVTTSALGCRDSVSRPGYVKVQRPIITIPAFPARGCIPYTLNAVPVINSVDPVTSYEWDFGDGGTSTLANPSYTYVAQGNYTVRLIITTSTGCRDTLTVPGAVRVGTKPVANFTAAPIPVCGRSPVSFTDLSMPADQWEWHFGDGGTSILQNPNYSYEDTGYFNVMLIAYNFGCPDTLVRVNYTHVLPPIAKFAFTLNCNDRMRVTFTDQSIAPESWTWNFGDGSPTTNIQNPTHSFPALGTYPVKLIVTNGSCIDSLTKPVNIINENPNFTADQTTACKPVNIYFTASVSNPLNIVSYFWDFGNDTLTTDYPTPSNYYGVSGLYSVMLVTTDIYGCRDTVIKPDYIRINGPIANFSGTNTGGCAGLITTFNDLSTSDGVNPIINWRFDFGDGVVQDFSAPPFQHTYNSVDTFTVRLKVTDSYGCSDSTIRQNFVITTINPIPNFNSIDTATCPGGPVYFVNESWPANVTSLWEFGDGDTSTANSPVHMYAATGFYSVKLRVQDPNGCADSLTRTNYIRVTLPSASFTVSDSISSCLPFEVQFTNTSTFHYKQEWDFGPGEGSSSLANPIHYFSSPGTFTVRLVITSLGECTDTITKTILVYDTTGRRVDYTPIGGCSPLSVNLDAFTTGPVASYFWDFGDGNTVRTTTPNVNHIYTSFGNYLPKVILEDLSGCIIPLQGLDTILVTGAKAKFGLDKDLFCDFGTVNFTDSTTFNDPVLLYNWSFGDGGTSNLPNPSHTYTSPGLYTVRLEVQTQVGCRDTLTKPNLVRVVQRPLIDIRGDSIICVNSSILHSGIFLIPDTSVVTWSWTFPNGSTSTLQNPLSQVYTVPGNYTITTIAVNSTGCKDTTTQNIYVNPLPVVTMPAQLIVNAGTPVLIPATYTPNTISWLWSPVTRLSCIDCPNPIASPKVNTLYQVNFTDVNGCTNGGVIELIVICSNATLFMPNTFTPNGDGSNDIFYPRGKGLERVKTMRIFNRWGEVVFEKRDFPVNDAAWGWDGSFKGKKPQADVYVYQVEVFCENGDVIRLNGNIALIL